MRDVSLFRAIGFIILAIIIAWLLYYLFGLLSLLVYTASIGLVMLATAVVVGAICYGIFLMLKPKGQKVKVIQQHKVYDVHGKPIYVFRNEPELIDVVKVHDELHLTKLELQGDVFSIANDSAVIVLEDTGKESVKIRVKGAANKGDREGWVGRSCLVKENKQITGPK